MGSPYIIVGTRPEAIKLGPVVRELDECVVVLTGQHDARMVRQDIEEVAGNAAHQIQFLLDPTMLVASRQASIAIVQGDTWSALHGAIAAYDSGIPVAHVEAGLRTYDLRTPWPEEGYRQMISRISSIHFAPTATARDNLLREGIAADTIHVVGNTVIDALVGCHAADVIADIPADPFALVTAHRRENIDQLPAIASAINKISERINVLVVSHVRESIAHHLGRHIRGKRVSIVEPVPHDTMLGLMSRASLVITDSGGLQEEAAFFGVPIVILRNKTERPEVIERGLGVLAGTDPDRIVEAAFKQIKLPRREYDGCFGDGAAAKRIAEIIQQFISSQK